MITRLRKHILQQFGDGYQNHLADELAINRGRMSQYATGTRKIPTHHLLMLADKLGVAPHELVGYEDMEVLL